MVSAVVLTKNEEKNLNRCLKSLSWCDEVIIIDDFSIDRTVEIAKKHQAKVFQRPLNNNFASQRNFGLQQTRGEWVLFVDADEAVRQKLQKEIRSVVQNRAIAKICAGYYLKRQDYFLGKWLKFGETANTKLLRLAQKEAGQWQRAVHEFWNIKGKVGQLKNPLFHYHQIFISEFLERINSYTTINAQALIHQGRRESISSLLFFPLVKFIQNYFFRLGFLDGFSGLVMAFLMSYHSLATRVKIWELHHGKIS